MLVLSVLIVLVAGVDGARMVSVGQGACRQSGHGMVRIGCSQSRSEAQGLSTCIAKAACGAMDWDPAANQTCLWGSVSPAVHAVESACGQAPHPAGCRCYKKSPLPTPQPPKVPPVTNCTSDEGCQLNGVCKSPGVTSGSCECTAGWKGFDCGELDLIPGPRPNASGLLANGSVSTGGILSTWGGAVVHEDNVDNSTWHMFAAAMLGGCGIRQWGTNSENWTRVTVVRAVADTPLGPFHIVETVVPRFAHEPNVVTAEDGSVVMFFFAANCSGGQCGPQQNCSKKEMWPWNEMKSMQANVLHRNNELSAVQLSGAAKLNYMMHAKSPRGPWSKPVLLSPGPACSGGPTKAITADLNMNAAIASDGSLVGLWRCVETLSTTQPGATVLHAVTASNWRDASTYRWSSRPAFPTQGFGSEDPFVYQSTDGAFHAILHDEQGLPGKHYPDISRASAYGRHAWSRTGSLSNWSISPWLGGSLAYNSTVHFSDGSTHNFLRRERPHLVVGTDRSLIALTNGASPEADPNQMCFTLAQPIARK